MTDKGYKTRYYRTPEGFVYSWTMLGAPNGVTHLARLSERAGRALYGRQTNNLKGAA